MADSKFPYTPLDASIPEIRLVTIHPASTGDPVTCSLEVARLDECRFEALSYVWGDTAVTRPITVSGQRFDVTENLSAALPNLRSEDHARTFWIDAICINQNVLEEQNSQVSLMRDVYKNASCVVVWLGAGTPESDSVFAFFNSPGNAEARKPLAPGMHETDESAVASAMDNLYHDLRHRPWFRRVWVIQEIAVARKILVRCGLYEITWEALLGWWTKLEGADVVASGPPGGYDWADVAKTLPRLSRTRDLVQTSWSSVALSPSMGELLAWHRTFQASIPRDKVHGLLGLHHHDSGALLDPLLRPDYAKKTSDQQVFMKAVEYCIIQDGRLDILTLSQAGNRTSWVPNWASEWTAPGSPSTLLLQKYNINSPLSLLREAASTSDSLYCDWRSDNL